MNNLTPYANLNPNLILEAIETLGLRCTGGLLALNSYENRVYQIGIEDDKPMIAKFYRPERWSSDAILEEHLFSQELVDHDIPVVAPWRNKNGETLHEHQGYRFALFASHGGRALELEGTEKLEWMGRFVGRLHAVGACKPFQHREQMSVQTQGYSAYHFLLEQQFIPAHLAASYEKITGELLKNIEHAFQPINTEQYIRCHGDLHTGNVLWRDEGPHIVDLDDCIMAPAIQDIWLLLSGNHIQVKRQLVHILRGYQAFHDFDRRELPIIEALRTLRMIKYAGWLAKRWQDPTFPLNFPWFNTVNYWQEHIENLTRQQAHLVDSIRTR
jgi:Ser/Thr protein kinase RdoA (MazF antagonist)